MQDGPVHVVQLRLTDEEWNLVGSIAQIVLEHVVKLGESNPPSRQRIAISVLG